jgi:hypothetical protein
MAVYRAPRMKYFYSAIQSWLVTELRAHQGFALFMMGLDAPIKCKQYYRRHLSGKTDYCVT